MWFPVERYALSDYTTRVVEDDNLTFSGYTTSRVPFAITVKLSDANRWVNGELIQNCFPYLNTEDREILMTGNDNAAWERMFGSGEDDE
jgi:hypothetical protein